MRNVGGDHELDHRRDVDVRENAVEEHKGDNGTHQECDDGQDRLDDGPHEPPGHTDQEQRRRNESEDHVLDHVEHEQAALCDVVHGPGGYGQQKGDA